MCCTVGKVLAFVSVCTPFHVLCIRKTAQDDTTVVEVTAHASASSENSTGAAHLASAKGLSSRPKANISGADLASSSYLNVTALSYIKQAVDTPMVKQNPMANKIRSAEHRWQHKIRDAINYQEKILPSLGFTKIILMILWMCGQIFIMGYILDHGHEVRGNQIGIKSVLCMLLCAPGGCLAVCYPMDEGMVGRPVMVTVRT